MEEKEKMTWGEWFSILIVCGIVTLMILVVFVTILT